MFELSQLGHVRLHKDSPSEDSPPGPDCPQLQAETAHQPDWGGGELDVLEVFGHRLHVLGLEDQGHHWPGPGQTPQESLHGWAEVWLAWGHLQHLLDPQAEAGGLREEAGHAVVGGRDQGHLARSQL